MVKIAQDDRVEVVRYARQFITPTDEIFHKRLLVITISLIRSIERKGVIDRVLELITPEMNLLDKLLIILAVGAPVVQKYAQGINVHEGVRDQRTRDAVRRFYAHQGVIEAGKIDQATEEFIEYLEAFSADAEQKKLAQKALSGAKQPGEPFGPLIDGKVFSILGLNVLGSDLIGRLWLYAAEFTEPEQTNAKNGMISALVSSYDHFGRVCNQGKTQRLVVAVLQGRLAEVNIEGEVIPEQVTTFQALEIFFQIPAHREIGALDALIAAALQFCRANPVVNQEQFLEQIKLYAQAQGLLEPAIIA